MVPVVYRLHNIYIQGIIYLLYITAFTCIVYRVYERVQSKTFSIEYTVYLIELDRYAICTV